MDHPVHSLHQERVAIECEDSRCGETVDGGRPDLGGGLCVGQGVLGGVHDGGLGMDGGSNCFGCHGRQRSLWEGERRAWLASCRNTDIRFRSLDHWFNSASAL
jgi:hypothetical protein